MYKLELKQVRSAPEWARDDILSVRNQCGGESCIADVRRQAITKIQGRMVATWIKSGAEKATSCRNAEHKSARCRCLYDDWCHENHLRCRCNDAERIAERKCTKAMEDKNLDPLSLMEVYSELRPCLKCREYFERLCRKGIRVVCFWTNN